MTKKHTPGPWIAAPAGRRMRDSYCQSWAIGEAGKANLIAGAFFDVAGGEPVAEANARVMAASPNMLKVLKAVASNEEVMKLLQRQLDETGAHICGNVRAAIADAEG